MAAQKSGIKRWMFKKLDIRVMGWQPKNQGLKAGCLKSWILGVIGWQQQRGFTSPGIFFQEMEPFILYYTFYFIFIPF